jgi:hypothetical protein
MLTREQLIKKYSERAYIGDAVYIHFDGYHFILETSDGMGFENRIGLEPEVIHNFLEYRKQCYSAFEDLVREEKGEMEYKGYKLSLEQQYDGTYVAVTDSYDGAPDAGKQLVGYSAYGATKDEALKELKLDIDENEVIE